MDQHQKINYKWLGSTADCIKKSWTPRFRSMMLNLRRTTSRGGKCYLLYEDWLEDGIRIDALEFVRKFSQSEGWTFESSAQRQIAPDYHETKFYQNSGKWEHLILLRN